MGVGGTSSKQRSAPIPKQRGASFVEYALLIAFIAVVCLASVSFLGSSAATEFSTLGSAISGSGS
jgi:Flp pilus assembly pilin Flp